MFLYYLWSHVKRSSTNSFVDLTFILELLGESKIRNFKLKSHFSEIDLSEELFPLILIHYH